jgi:methyl-accepting chemotaxis protein
MIMSNVRTTSTRWIRDRGVATKITTSVAIAVLVAVLVGIFGLKSLSTTADRTAVMYAHNTRGVQLAEEMRFHYISYRLGATTANTASTPEAKQVGAEQRDAAGEALLAAADRLRTETQPNAGMLGALGAVMENYDAYLVKAAEANKLRSAGMIAEYEALRANEITPLSTAIVTGLADLSALQQDAAKASATAAADSYTSTRTTLVVAIVVGSLLALLAGIFVARSITGALNRVRQAAERLADGDLTQATDVDQADEVVGWLPPWTPRRSACVR